MGFPASGARALPIGPQFNQPGGGLFAQPPASTGTGVAPSGFSYAPGYDQATNTLTSGNQIGFAPSGGALTQDASGGFKLLSPSGSGTTATFGSLQDAFNFMSSNQLDPTTGDYMAQQGGIGQYAQRQATPAPTLPRQLPQTMPQPLSAPSGFNVNQAAAGALQQAMGSTAGAITDPLRVSQYMNPYTQAVIERTQEDIERQRQMAANRLGAQASAAGAFGGSRQGVAEGVLAGEYGRMGADIAAQQRQTGYSQAMQSAMADRAARLGAAGQLAGLGQQAFGTGQAIQQQQAQQGLLQQVMQQQLIDAARGQYAGYTGAPMAATQAPLAALGVAPYPKSQVQSAQPGLFDYLTLGATAAARFCWVAREVYGEDNPKWLQFREWVIGYSPDWFFNAYGKYGEKLAAKVKRNPWMKKAIRPFMDLARKSLGYK